MSTKITKRVVDNLEYPKELNGRKPYIVWDTEIKGFGVRVYPTGKKSFVLNYRYRGRTKQPTIAMFGKQTVEQARTIAREWFYQIANGSDPAGTRKQQKDELLFQNVADKYLDEWAKPRKRTWKEDVRRVKSHLEPLHNQPISSVHREDVVALHRKINKKTGPYEANRCLALLSVIFRFALEERYLPDSQSNPAIGIKKFPEKKRDRWMQSDELQRFVQSVEAEKDPFMKAAFKFLLFSGLRRNEVLTLRWKNVFLPDKRIHLTFTKNNESRYVPLNAQAIEILTGLDREEANPFVFCSLRKPGHHIVETKTAMNRILERAKLDNVRIHDLRRTFASHAVTNGVPMVVVQKLLGHRDLGTTSSVYGHLADDPIREGSEQIASLLKR